MKLATSMCLATVIVTTIADRASLRFPHVHPRQYYAPPPYSSPVASSTFSNDFPPPTLSNPATGIPSSTGISLSSSPVNSTAPASSGLWNSTTIRSTVVITSQIVITVTPSPAVPVVTSTKPVTATSCKLTNEGLLWCTDPFLSSTPTTGTFTDATSVSFPVDTSTSRFGPPNSFPTEVSRSTGVSLTTGISLSTGSLSSYLPSNTPPYSNGTSSTFSWGTGTAPPASSTFTSPPNAMTSGGYYGPPASSSTPIWNNTRSAPTNSFTRPTDTSSESIPTPSSTSPAYTSYKYSFSSYISSRSSSDETTPTPTSTNIYHLSYSTTLPDIASTVIFDFPSSFTVSVSSASSSPSPSSSDSSITLTASSSASPSSSISFIFPPWPPPFTLTHTSSSSSSSSSASGSSINFLPPSPSTSLTSTPPFPTTSSSAIETTNTLSDSIPTFFASSSNKSVYNVSPVPTTSFTFTDGSFTSLASPTSISEPYPPYTPAPISSTSARTFTDGTYSSWDLPTSTLTFAPSTLSTLASLSSSSAEPSETEGYYGPPLPAAGTHAELRRAWKRLVRRQRGSADGRLKMGEDSVSWMRQGAVYTGARSARSVSGEERDVESEIGVQGVQMKKKKKKPVMDLWFM